MLTIEDKKNLIKVLTDLETEYPPSVLLAFLSEHTTAPSRRLVDKPEFKVTDLVKNELAIVIERGQKSINTRNGAWIAKLISQLESEVEANLITDKKQGRTRINELFNQFHENVKHHVDRLNTCLSPDVVNAELKEIAIDSFPKTPEEQKNAEIVRRNSEPFYREAVTFFNHPTLEIFLAQDAKQLSERVGMVVTAFPDHVFTKLVTATLHTLKDFKPTELTMPLYVAIAKAIVDECNKFKNDSKENAVHLVGLLRGIKKETKQRISIFAKDKNRTETGEFSELLRAILKENYPEYTLVSEITPDADVIKTIKTVHAQLMGRSKSASVLHRQ
ncbi:MAG: hypothetical protein ACYCQI_16180 [Gammaproteobacteria bacterium]